MAGVITENIQSRGFTVGKSNDRTLVFDIQGTDDEAEVAALIEAAAPAAYDGLVIESIDAEPVGGGIWRGRAKYVRLADNNEYTFNTGGGTSKITQSLSTVNSYAPGGGTAADFKGAIGVSPDGVQGADITVPQYEFSETHYFTDLAVNEAYRLTLFSLTGTVNNASFRGFDAGVVLFLGASGAKRGDEQWAITFNFACSPNVTGLSVGDITGIDKGGWEYLWVAYADFEDGTAFSLVKQPVAVYVEKVYNDGDFSLMGI